MLQEETYFEQAIRETEESIGDAEAGAGKTPSQLAWLIAHRPKPDDGPATAGQPMDLATKG